MFYSDLLVLHSYFRWIAILVLMAQIIWIFQGHYRGRTFTKKDLQILYFCCLILNIQLLLGWLLYFQSPLVKHFLQDIPGQIKNRELRFFGMEHVTMMSISILWMNFCAFAVQKHLNSKQGFSYLWKRHRWIILFILTSIPWSCSPLTSRPNWR